MEIKPNLTEKEVCRLVDRLITPERADREAAALAKILVAVTDGESSDDCYLLAMTAMHRAFQKTVAYQKSFENFKNEPLIGEAVGREDAPEKKEAASGLLH